MIPTPANTIKVMNRVLSIVRYVYVSVVFVYGVPAKTKKKKISALNFFGNST